MAKDDDILEDARELFAQCEEREADNRDIRGAASWQYVPAIDAQAVWMGISSFWGGDWSRL